MEPAGQMLRKAASDFWWTPEFVDTVETAEYTISFSETGNPLFNQAIPHQTPSNPDDFLAQVGKYHTDCSRFWVTECSDDAKLRTSLKAHGYALTAKHGAYVIDTENYPTFEEFVVQPVETDLQMREMYAARQAIFGGEIPDDAQLELELSQCTGSASRVGRFVAVEHGEVLGTGSLTYFDDLSLAFIWAGGVKTEHRGRGVYKALIAARAAACRERGIRTLGLYARLDTSAPIVAAHGFRRCGFLDYYELGR